MTDRHPLLLFQGLPSHPQIPRGRLRLEVLEDPVAREGEKKMGKLIIVLHLEGAR